VETDLRPLNLVKATDAGQSGMAATRGNGNVDLDKLLNDDSQGVLYSSTLLSTMTLKEEHKRKLRVSKCLF